MIPFYIGEVMRRKTEQLEKERRAARAVEKLNEPETDLIVVTDDGKPVGVFTHSEAVKLVEEQKDPSSTTLGECSLSPVVTIDESENVETAAAIMEEKGLKYLLVEKANKIVGYLTDRDISAALSEVDQK